MKFLLALLALILIAAIVFLVLWAHGTWDHSFVPTYLAKWNGRIAAAMTACGLGLMGCVWVLGRRGSGR